MSYFWKDLLKRGDDELDFGDPLQLLCLLVLCDYSRLLFLRAHFVRVYKQMRESEGTRGLVEANVNPVFSLLTHEACWVAAGITRHLIVC